MVDLTVRLAEAASIDAEHYARGRADSFVHIVVRAARRSVQTRIEICRLEDLEALEHAVAAARVALCAPPLEAVHG